MSTTVCFPVLVRSGDDIRTLTSHQVFGQIWGQIFDQVFVRGFRDLKTQFTGLLGQNIDCKGLLGQKKGYTLTTFLFFRAYQKTGYPLTTNHIAILYLFLHDYKSIT